MPESAHTQELPGLAWMREWTDWMGVRQMGPWALTHEGAQYVVAATGIRAAFVRVDDNSAYRETPNDTAFRTLTQILSASAPVDAAVVALSDVSAFVACKADPTMSLNFPPAEVLRAFSSRLYNGREVELALRPFDPAARVRAWVARLRPERLQATDTVVVVEHIGGDWRVAVSELRRGETLERVELPLSSIPEWENR